MRILRPPLVFLLLGCAQTPTPKPDAAFVKEEICSAESLAHLSARSRQGPGPGRVSSPDEIQQRLAAFVPKIQSCYQEELIRTGDGRNSRLCLVFSHDHKGKLDFYGVSSREMAFSRDLQNCFERLRSSKDLKGLANTLVVQPLSFFVRTHLD